MSTNTSQDIESFISAAAGGSDGPATARGASALRVRCHLQPAAGPGAKVMPPTYSGQRGPVYVRERRRIGDETHDCVLLDSTASQANRLEDALLDAQDRGVVRVPDILVDQAEFGVNSAMRFPHRCFDAWVEDAELQHGEGVIRFGDSGIFGRMARASRRNLAGLMDRFPVGVILGCWASRAKAPQGATRLPRLLAGEIVAVGAEEGERPKSRLDPHPVSASVRVFESDAPHERFTLNEERAKRDAKGKPTPFGAPGKDAGRPSMAGYGNVVPSLADHGGITMDHALHLTTLSLPGLRECRFPFQNESAEERREDWDIAGRMMLAALALTMLAEQAQRGYDLRSGCLLVPVQEPTVELVGRLGEVVESWPLAGLDARRLLKRTVAWGVDECGFSWDPSLALTASESQLALLRASLTEANGEAE